MFQEHYPPNQQYPEKGNWFSCSSLTLQENYVISGTRTSSYGAGFSTVSHEFELLQQRLQQTLHHRQTQEVENMKSELESAEQKALEYTGIIKEGKSCIKELENQLQNASKIGKTQLKAAQAELDRCKKAAAASQSKWKEHANDADSLKLELEELRKSIEATDIQLKGNDILFLSLNCMFQNYLCTVYINFLFFI
jgi:chromosome segregation ATPase